jgi:hypothetical protein
MDAHHAVHGRHAGRYFADQSCGRENMSSVAAYSFERVDDGVDVGAGGQQDERAVGRWIGGLSRSGGPPQDGQDPRKTG